MNDQNPDSAFEEGTTPQPAANVPSTSGQPNSQVTIETLLKRIDVLERSQRALQSDKDRGVAQTRKELSEIRPLLEEVKRLRSRGIEDDEEIIERLELKELKRQVLEQRQSASDQPVLPGKQNQPGGVEIEKVAEKLGLSVDDPEVAAAILVGGTEGIATMVQVAAKRVSAPKPSPASSPAMPGGTPPVEDKNALKAQYVQELQANRGNRVAIKNIQKKYSDKGLDVGSIGFSV